MSSRSFHRIFILSGINSCLNETNPHDKGKRIQTKRSKSSLLKSIKCTVITHIPALNCFFTFTAKTTPTHPQTQSRTYTHVNLETFDERRITGDGAELEAHKPDMYLPFRFSSTFIHFMFMRLMQCWMYQSCMSSNALCMYLCNKDGLKILKCGEKEKTHLISLRLDRTEDLNDEVQSPLGNIDGRRAMVDKVEAAKRGG